MLVLAALAFTTQHRADERVTPDDIVVQSPQLRSVRAALTGFAPASRAKDPIARFTDPICVASSGLPEQAEHVIVDRVEETAASVGLKVGSPGCTPNVFILFVSSGKASVRQLLKKGSPAVAGQSLADMKRIAAQPAPVKAWSEIELRSRDGDRPTYYSGRAPELAVVTSSIFSLPVRRDILNATIMLDRKVIPGMSLTRIANYTAMRALTGAKSDRRLGKRSILSLFTGDNKEAPEAATAFDRGYLRGLYEGRADLPDTIKRSAIVRRIADSERRG